MRGLGLVLLTAGALVALASPGWAGPISAGSGSGPLGPVSDECRQGSGRAARATCSPDAFRRGEVSRQGDIRCFERPTAQGVARVCRD